MRLKLLVAYEGGAFRGWQSQRNGSGVQDMLRQAALRIAGQQQVVVHGAGRTDAGVHATGQCCHMDVSGGPGDPDAWLRALNGNLPPSLRVLRASRAPASFHARFSATGKIYRYRLAVGPVLMPLDAGRAWHVPGLDNIEAVRTVARLFTGCHDFAAFSAKRLPAPRSTVREIREISATRYGEILTLAFEGDGFLYKMVRMLVAAIVRCASGAEPAAALAARLRERSPRWTHVAPACGLTLVRVLYARPRGIPKTAL
jgi:tRNA pseudouridine38-40 synthase